MRIIYTINGRKASWCVSERDKYELQRIMNDGIGIPADPMLDVLVFAAYMGEYNTFYGFYRDFVEEFLDPEELFDTEPIEYFNTVLQPMFEDDIKILDIEWGVVCLIFVRIANLIFYTIFLAFFKCQWCAYLYVFF